MEDSIFKKLMEFVESPEGKLAMDEQVLKWEKEDLQEERNYKRFCRLVEKNGLDNLVDKIKTYYNSDKYVNRERKLGYEPREPLLDYLFTYSKEFGEENDEDLSIFTSEQYKVGKWLVGLAIGQGSFIYVNEVK